MASGMATSRMTKIALCILVVATASVAAHSDRAVELTNADFARGTYRITTPGVYRLAEDIVFNPNADVGEDPYDSFFPTPDQLGDEAGQYPQPEFTLGFFAAITVEASGVDIDLNGHSIEQSAAHALMQRFFAVIELANSPFIPGQGPHSFTSQLLPAQDFKIYNGRVGRSSHHGIHGNNNTDIRITNVTFDGFEVAAVHLNGVDGLVMESCDMTNRKDIPVVGTFSAVRFLQRYVDYLVDTESPTTLEIAGSSLDAVAVRDSLRNAVNNVYYDVVATGSIDAVAHPQEYGLFANPNGFVDGNAYCVVINKLGVAVDGFPFTPAQTQSKRVILRDLSCDDHVAGVREVVALSQNNNAMNDPVGALIQFLNKDPNGEYLTIETKNGIHDAWYTGNPVANAQMFVGQAAIAGEFAGSPHDVSRNKVTPAVIHWVEAGELGVLGDLYSDEGWLCNGDSMFHVNKGLVSYMISGTIGAQISRVGVNTATNVGAAGSDVCGEYTFSHPLATIPFYSGATARGFSFAGSSEVYMRRTSVRDLTSLSGDAVAFDVQTDSSTVDLSRVLARDIVSEAADAFGVRFGAESRDSSVKALAARDIRAKGQAFEVFDQGVNNNY